MTDPHPVTEPTPQGEWPHDLGAVKFSLFKIMEKHGFTGELNPCVVEMLTHLENIGAFNPAGLNCPTPPAEVTEEEIAGVIYDNTFGGTSDPTLDETLQAICRDHASKIMSLLRKRAMPAPDRELAGEREAHAKTRNALEAKDKAMGELFARLEAAGVDCSDLIS